MRVLIVAPSTRLTGGQSLQAAMLREHLQDTGAVDVLFAAIDPEVPAWLSWMQRFTGLRTLINEAWLFATLVRDIRRVDVVHAFSASYWSYLLNPLPAVMLGRAFGRPTVLHYHSGEADDHLATWKGTVWSMRKFASSIVVPSDYLVNVFNRHGLTARCIPNFVEVDRVPFRVRTAPTPRFLANRALESLYNLPCIIRAFARIQAEVPTASLTIAGDGSERPMLERQVSALGLRDVRFVGRLPNHEMIALYDEHDVYLNSPNIDNMPGSLIECGAAGLPIVSTNAGGIPYIVRHEETALLVDIDDDAALAAAALRLLREPGLAARLGRAGRADVVGRYTWSEVSGSWQELYQTLAQPYRRVA